MTGTRTIATVLAVVIATATIGLVAGTASGQLSKTSRIGILDTGSPSPEREALWNIFRQALREAGHVEGKNVGFVFRWGGGQPASLRTLAAELVRAPVDLIVTAGTPAALAAKQETATIPIVLVVAGDPVRTGLAASLGRPGGNVTGLTTLSTELSGKRLELLLELLPALKQIGIVWDDNPSFAPAVQDTEVAARRLNVDVRAVVVRNRNELETVFADFARLRLGAIEVMPGRLFLDERALIAQMALRHRLPTVYAQREYVEAGGLLSYGSNLSQLFLRAAAYADRILKGARPADLPIEQPTKFELVLNLKTARALGLTIPPPLRVRADQIIE
jgi:ABC-type uncharacterized transport system substrate-binding protein